MSESDFSITVPDWSLEPTFTGTGLKFLPESLNFLVDKPMLLGGPLAYLALNYVLTAYMKNRLDNIIYKR